MPRIQGNARVGPENESFQNESKLTIEIKLLDSSSVTNDRLGFSVFLNAQTKQSVHEIA